MLWVIEACGALALWCSTSSGLEGSISTSGTLAKKQD